MTQRRSPSTSSAWGAGTAWPCATSKATPCTCEDLKKASLVCLTLLHLQAQGCALPLAAPRRTSHFCIWPGNSVLRSTELLLSPSHISNSRYHKCTSEKGGPGVQVPSAGVHWQHCTAWVDLGVAKTAHWGSCTSTMRLWALEFAAHVASREWTFGAVKCALHGVHRNLRYGAFRVDQAQQGHSSLAGMASLEKLSGKGPAAAAKRPSGCRWTWGRLTTCALTAWCATRSGATAAAPED